MGYSTRVEGRIIITPPISAADLRKAPEVTDREKTAYVHTAEETVETDDGILTRINGDAIVPHRDEAYKTYDLVEDVQRIVSAFPTRKYTGFFSCYGEDNTDIWRLEIRDRRAVEVRPRITWPDGTEETF